MDGELAIHVNGRIVETDYTGNRRKRRSALTLCRKKQPSSVVPALFLPSSVELTCFPASCKGSRV